MEHISPKSIFYPLFAMFLVTFAVGAALLRARTGTMKKNRISPQRLADGAKWDELLREAENPSDAFENMFEVPVLFYVIGLSLFVTGHVTLFFVSCAWVFVFLRAVQAWIHCTSNIIMQRAIAFWLGCGALAAMWIGFIVDLSQQGY